MSEIKDFNFGCKKTANKEEIKENQLNRLDQVARYNLEKEKEKINNNSNLYSFVGSIKCKSGPKKARIKESVNFLVEIVELLNSSKTENKQLNSVKEKIKQYSIDSCVDYLDSPDVTSKDRKEMGSNKIIELDLGNGLNFDSNATLNECREISESNLKCSLIQELEKYPDIKEKMYDKAQSKNSSLKKSDKKSGKKKSSKKKTSKKNKSKSTKKKVSKNGRKTKNKRT